MSETISIDAYIYIYIYLYDAEDIGSPGAKRTALYFIFIYYYIFNIRNAESVNVEDLCGRIYYILKR